MPGSINGGLGSGNSSLLHKGKGKEANQKAQKNGKAAKRLMLIEHATKLVASSGLFWFIPDVTQGYVSIGRTSKQVGLVFVCCQPQGRRKMWAKDAKLDILPPSVLPSPC